MNDQLEERVLPLSGIRVLAVEQFQAMPIASLMLARLGADVVKIEPPATGEAGRSSLPFITDTDGSRVGATFLRYNLNKRSVGIDVKSERGRALIHDLVPHFDVFCENMGPGRAEKYELGYGKLSALHPSLVYASITGFGMDGTSPYFKRPAFAPVAEAMSGIYDYGRIPGHLPVMSPMGGVGDWGPGMLAVVGVLAALRHRDQTGEGQLVDISMFDTMISVGDIVANFWSMGLEMPVDGSRRTPLINHAFRASDGWFMMMVNRRHQFERLSRLLGQDAWLDDPRLADAWGWVDHLDTVIRPVVEEWAAGKDKQEAAAILAKEGIAAAPGNSAEDLTSDPHVVARNMLVEIPRTDGVEQPVLVAGNPVKMSSIPDELERPFPKVGEHTEEVLQHLLGLDAADLADLRRQGAI